MRLVGADPEVTVARGGAHRRGDDGGACGGRTSVTDEGEQNGSNGEAEDVQEVEEITLKLNVGAERTEGAAVAGIGEEKPTGVEEENGWRRRFGAP
jgi:hypothetical protein